MENDNRPQASGDTGAGAVDELTEFVHAKHTAVRQQVQAQRDSELAYVCRCGQQFTRGGGDGSSGERAYLEHIGFRDTGLQRVFGTSYGGCSTMIDMLRNRKQAICWYGRHRAQIINMEANAHQDAEVRRLMAIIESQQATATGFQQATDTINNIVAYIRSNMPEELGRPTDQTIITLLTRLKKLQETRS